MANNKPMVINKLVLMAPSAEKAGEYNELDMEVEKFVFRGSTIKIFVKPNSQMIAKRKKVK